MPKIDIVIPHYNEPWELGGKLFSILALQRGIDFSDIHVLLIHDGEENKFPDEYFNLLPYEVQQITIPHKGVSAARNKGIDMATAEWIMFCDFDDTFTSIYSLRDIIDVLPAEGYDMLYSRLLVEDPNKDFPDLYFSPKTHNYVFVHGKVYRREFLIEQNIRFDETMNFQEDSLFNATIVARTDRTHIGQIKSIYPIYVWIKRPGSTSNSGRTDEALYSHFLRNLRTTEENRKNRTYRDYAGMVTRTVWDAYHMLTGKSCSDATKQQIREAFLPWIKNRIHVFGDVKEDILEKIISISRSELRNTAVPDDPVTVKKWLDSLLKGEE